MADAEQFDILVNNKKVQCWKWGNGPVIIFVHGWSGRGIQFHRYFKKVVGAGYSVVTFDGPGHGESDGTTSTYFQMTDAVRAVLWHCRPENVHGLVGHSIGASTIINALEKERLQIPVVLLAPAIRLKELLDRTFDQHGVPAIVYLSLIEEFEAEFGYSLVRDNPINLLEMHAPRALIIHDEDDRVTSFEDSRAAAARHNSLTLHKTRGLGHKRILHNRAVIQRALDFLVGENSPHINNYNPETWHDEPKTAQRRTHFKTV